MLLWGLLCTLWLMFARGQAQGSLPQVPPYFFLCNYHSNTQELGAGTGEVKLRVAISGNPNTYTPGNFYQVTISSSLNFDGFFVSGLYTISNSALAQSQAHGIQGNQPVGQNLACNIVHTHMSREPVHEFKFLWVAPPRGTGCVSFLATATLQHQLLFKDTSVLQLCEEGAASTGPLRPDLAVLHSDAIIFRDDFDTFDSFNPSHWLANDGASVGQSCGSVFYGDAAAMCSKSGHRELITQPLNTTTAGVLQFTIGKGTCGTSELDQYITVSFGLNNCQSWFELDRFRPPLPSEDIPQTRLIHLPLKARGEGICFAWKQAPTIARSKPLPSSTTTTPAAPVTVNLFGQRQRMAGFERMAMFNSATKPSPAITTTSTTSTTTLPTTTTTTTTTPPTTSTATTTTTTTTLPPTSTTTTPIYIPEDTTTSWVSGMHDYDIRPVIVNDDPGPVADDPVADDKRTKTGTGRQKLVYKVGNKVLGGAQGEQAPGTYQGCWAIDEVIIVNQAHVPSTLQDNFDPVDPSDWIVFPGAYFKHQCQSDGAAMVFNHNASVTGTESREIDLSVANLSPDLMLDEQFESKTQPGWDVVGGHVDVTCGVIYQSNSMVFNGGEQIRKICTPYIDIRKAGNVRFYFSLGGGGCHSDVLNKAEVIVYLEDEDFHTLYIVERLNIRSYTEPHLVSLPLSPVDRHARGRICWLQKYTGGKGLNVWALDNVQVLPHIPEKNPVVRDKMVQFSLNLQCANYPHNNQVDLHFSTNHGQTWHLLHEPCLPEQCSGDHHPTHTSYSGTDFTGWKRVTVPLPYAAMVPYTRFRWMKTSDDDPNWALDSVFVGDCPDGCNAHGTCSDGSCQCDFGYQGPTCKESIGSNPTILMENFEGSSLLTSVGVERISGASLGYECDVLSTGKAVVFNKDGHRQLVTGELDTSNNKYIQFNIRVGSNSPVSNCPAPDETKELVMLDYSCNGGITWKLLKTFNIHEYRQPKSDSVALPAAARDTSCKFRWWQAEHSGPGTDVWALDDLSLNDHLFNTLHLHMGNLVDIGESLTVTHGYLSDNYCRRMKSISFIGEHQADDIRLLTTESMHIGPGYIVQFELVMGCGLPYEDGPDSQLYLEYSDDHGIHWDLVQDPCLPPASCAEVTQGTVYHWTQYRKWTRVTVPLPAGTWGPSTRFRFRQANWSPTDTWGIARLYIGQQCLKMCHGHGQCNEGVCDCDEGFEGESCDPSTHLDDQMLADFGMRYEPDSDFLHIRGGKVVSSNRGCGNIHADESLYFYDDGMRELITKDMDTRKSDMLQFYLRIGGSRDTDCHGGERRSEGIILQYSNNGGITWTLLEELLNTEYGKPRFVVVQLPQSARSPNTRFRWWQPQHDGKGQDQWAVDEIQLSRHERLRSLEDDFNGSVDPLDSGVWRELASGVIGKYCNSRNPVLILANQEADKSVVTKDLTLKVGDVIQFKINVGCSNQFRWDHPVLLQYWPEGGRGYKLVQDPCYQDMECGDRPREGSMYYTGPHGHWQLIVIPITEQLAKYPVFLRWWQPGGYPYNFALDDVYIGPPCTDNCHRNGACKQGACSCYTNKKDAQCQSDDPTPYGLVDRFEQHHRPSDFWKRIWGGHLGVGCGRVDRGNALFFDGEGTREAVTIAMNTTYLRMLEFVLKLGSTDGSCVQPTSRSEGVIVDYSTDNEITWKPLKLVEPTLYNGTVERVILELPPEAKTDHTNFRWWQPLGYGGMERTPWGLDSVTLGVNETNLEGFQDDFAGMMPDMFTWYQTESAVPRITCNSKGNALEFSRNGERRYAETWDYHVTPSTFLQFNIAMGCDSLYDTLYGVMLEYSTDMGKSWQSVVSACTPPNYECSGYHLESDYMSDQHRNWTRISVYLPPAAVSPATRFRWKQHSQSPSANVWALDNVYLGDGCPWLCSGHGYCSKGTCVCDDGYTGEYCVPSKPLPMMLRDDFNRDKPLNSNWLEVYGGSLNTMCGTLVSGNALTFSEDQLRMVVSRDIDTTMLNTVEFYFLYGCNDKRMDWPRKESVLLQYSNNGGITWNLVKELHYRNETGARFFSLELPMKARHNSTRFRFWQPANAGKMLSTWAVDNLFIGRMTMNPSSMQDDFESGVQSDSWLFVNDGTVGPFCEANTRNDTVDAGHSALVFKHGPETGEHSIVTRDLDVGPMSVLQFDINVGCASEATDRYPVRLEYSSDGGKSWNLVVPNCARVSQALCYDSVLHPSLYYGGTSRYWRRVVIPLDNLYVCGSLRFRWYQGFIPDDDFGPEWAIDNIFIGMACMEHCLGQGDCGGTMMCTCDPGYQGDTCQPSQSYPIYMKEGFTLRDGSEDVPEVLTSLDAFVRPDRLLNEDQWDTWSGARVSRECSLLVDNHALVFKNPGERTLVTRPFDFSKATTVQFYLRLGCGRTPPDPTTPPVYTQYSTNGGISWHTIEQFDFNKKSNKPFYVVLNLPPRSRSPASQLRWWQPSKDGTFMEDWAVDEIYIGGDYDGVPMLADEPAAPKDPNWTMNPGGNVESACSSPFQAIHFTGEEKHRFAVTADVVVESGTVFQFDIAMGCTEPKHCFTVELEYSLDKGITWQHVWEACLPSNLDCHQRYYPASHFSSVTNWGWNRHTIQLPPLTKSQETRFRWYQKEGYNVKDKWAIANLFIGSNCEHMCSGHGKCSPNGCLCDDRWEGDTCSAIVHQLPQYLYDMFTSETNNWLKIAGGKRTKVCKTLASGEALHFTGGCERKLVSVPLDLSEAVYIQFYFMYGCHSIPDNLDESVLIAFSTDGGITFTHTGLLHYLKYRNPTYVTLQLPKEARYNGTQISFMQMVHSGADEDDWMIDNLRVGGNQVNPDKMESNFTDGIDPAVWNTLDNMRTGEYCGRSNAAIGEGVADESATLTTQDLAVSDGHMLQFWYNIGCMRPWNQTVAPIHLQYSTDYGMTWSYVVPQCLSNNPACPTGATMASVYYGDPMGRWQRVILPLTSSMLSKATRFRWQQRPVTDVEAVTEFGIRDVFIGPACDSMCGGHGNCHLDNHPACHCDEGYFDSECYPWRVRNPVELKDVFGKPGTVDKSKWSLVQGGDTQDPCTTLVESSALVLNGPGMRQVVSVDMDLRDAKFVQYTATIGGYEKDNGCFEPYSHDQSVVLQYSTDGGISWHSLHTLDYKSYRSPRRDYIVLPQEARTQASRIRWWQPLPEKGSNVQPTWAIDDVYIGGKEINPAQFQINFNETVLINDQPWEFNPHGRIDTAVCKKEDSVITWDAGRGERHFTTKQMIVQSNYILQFKIAVGCSQSFNICVSHPPVKLMFNKNPAVNQWHQVLPLCLPDLNQRMDCHPNMYHLASEYTPDTYPSWTRVTISLPEKTFSSTTRFRWLQDSPDTDAPGWALDDVYVGEECLEMCHGRGDCTEGVCHCDQGYTGSSCMPAQRQLMRMFDGFEGGIYTSHWDWVSGGGIGFGCGALLPYAHGKSLYFNGCGIRQARTVEMDLRRASKIIFVLQIGCRAQTAECNIKVQDESQYRGILLQYSLNKGSDWILIARHDPGDYLAPKRVAYDIPLAARTRGAQFRWWQPVHGGEGFDQWAMDHVEIVPGRARLKYYKRRR